ncbi:inhibitor of trypsin and hageman factor-like [Oryza glaberrima]|uniref:Uncharacterized protein n=1 Tax=Oryza barthii TaxID=65489 RepID=A0A0D3GFY7_9ORYZ|nr:inhibitor of trypsin and hageman factor-like [Oryza glaberrima]
MSWACPSLPNCPNGKSSWPELVGKKGSEAMAVILRERPDITRAILVPQDAVIADDYCCNRVRILVDCGDGGGDCGDASVTAVPMIG